MIGTDKVRASTHEIGIRLAIGALEGDVELQFLIEAVVQAAIASETQRLISGELDLLSVKPIEALRICTPA